MSNTQITHNMSTYEARRICEEWLGQINSPYSNLEICIIVSGKFKESINQSWTIKEELQYWAHRINLLQITPKVKNKGKNPKNIAKTIKNVRVWKLLRYQVFELSGNFCRCCGNTPQNGAVLTVDHIKPISKYPELALELSNLQVLCSECNEGKANFWDKNWNSPTAFVSNGGW